MKTALGLLLLCLLQESRESYEARARDLEEALKNAAAVDTLSLKEGRKLAGKIEEETAEYVRLKARFGAMKFQREDVARIERSPVREILTKVGAARDKVAELQTLMDWAAKNNPAQGSELAPCLILAVDPAHVSAKAAAAGSSPAAGQADRDVILLKDGNRKEGIIAS